MDEETYKFVGLTAQDFTEAELPRRVREVYSYLRSHGAATAREISWALSIPKRTVYYALEYLRKKELVAEFGRNYEPGIRGKIAKVFHLINYVTDTAIKRARQVYMTFRSMIGKLEAKAKTALAEARKILQRVRFGIQQHIRDFWVEKLSELAIKVQWFNSNLANELRSMVDKFLEPRVLS